MRRGDLGEGPPVGRVFQDLRRRKGSGRRQCAITTYSPAYYRKTINIVPLLTLGREPFCAARVTSMGPSTNQGSSPVWNQPLPAFCPINPAAGHYVDT